VRTDERGEGLVDAVVAGAIASIAVAAIISGTLAATHRFGAQPVEESLQHLVQREMRIAADVLKYQGGTIAPTTIATTAPLPGGSPLPVHVSIAVTALTTGGYSIDVQATADSRSESATVTTTVPQPVPLPSSNITSPDAAAAPI
jgi:hypothetical protein